MRIASSENCGSFILARYHQQFQMLWMVLGSMSDLVSPLCNQSINQLDWLQDQLKYGAVVQISARYEAFVFHSGMRATAFLARCVDNVDVEETTCTAISIGGKSHHSR